MIVLFSVISNQFLVLQVLYRRDFGLNIYLSTKYTRTLLTLNNEDGFLQFRQYLSALLRLL